MSTWEEIQNKIKNAERFGMDETLPRSLDTLSVADYWQRRFEEEHRLLEKSIESKEKEMDFLKERVERQRTELQLTRAELESFRLQLFDKQRYWEERHRSLELENQGLKEKISWEVQVRVLEEQNKFLTEHGARKEKASEEDVVARNKWRETETARVQLASELQSANEKLNALLSEKKKWEEERTQKGEAMEALNKEKTALEEKLQGLSGASAPLQAENERLAKSLADATRTLARLDKHWSTREQDYLLNMEDLARGFAHRVRNYLGIMSGTLQLALSGEKMEESLKEQILLVDQNAQEMLKTIEEFLSLSRIPEMSLETLDLNQYLRQTVSALEEKCSAAKIKIEWEMAENLPSVRVDTRLMGEAVSAVVLNAVEAMPDGG
ncbi:MAG TPA: hypothetical protein P5079_11150, partial [Elusimicrobiota bacterium]|nr:hypothetical protein [Elusimicrobiota bacterium]